MAETTVKEFQLTIRVCALIVYQAIIKLDEPQYEALLDTYRKDGWSVISGETSTVEELTGEPFDKKRDYAKEAPDAIVAALICARAENLFSGWSDFRPFGKTEAMVDVKENNTEEFLWECVPVDGKIR